MVVAIVGMIGAGKTTAVERFVKHGFHHIYFGQVVFDEMKRRGLAPGEAGERSVREELRAKFGMAVMAERSLPAIRAALAAGKDVVIGSLYSWEEFVLLREKLPEPIILVAVAASRAERYQRLLSRPERPLNTAEAESRDWSHVEKLNVGGPIAYADHTIASDGGLADFQQRLDVLIASL